AARPVRGLERRGLAGLPDVRTIRVPRRRGRGPPPTVCERRDHEGSVRPDEAGHHAKPKPASIDEATTTGGPLSTSTRTREPPTHFPIASRTRSRSRGTAAPGPR